MEVVVPAPVLERPAGPRAGRHVAACPGCQAPLLLDYLYGYSQGIEAAHCPRCARDLSAWAWQEWPRCEDGAHAMDLRVSLVVPAHPAERVEVHPIEMAPLLRSA